MLNNETTKLPTPTIHLNGTGARDLRAQAKEVYRGLNDALQAMRQAMPHGRDYYPQGDAALTKARDAHTEMIIMVTRIQDEYLSLAVKIADAEHGE
jgi:hypothetical protein